MKENELIGLFLPEGVQEFFEVTSVDKRPECYILHLSEKNIVPEAYQQNKLVSKGFYEPSTIQDFPLRGKACYLIVKRRRWLNLDTGEIVSRDWDLVANGTRMTLEFAAFLKEFNRYHPGKH